MADSVETETLIRRAQEGEDEARRALFAQVEDSVIAIVRNRMGRRLRERMESVDIAQSAVGDALRDFDQFEGGGDRAVIRWLARIVENKLRKRAREQRYGDRDPARVRAIGAAQTDCPAVEPLEQGPGAATVVQQDEQCDLLREALQRLTERERRLIELRDLEELAWTDVVERAQEPSVKAAQGCYARARARLASSLRTE